MFNPNRRHLQLALTSLALVGVGARAQTSLERAPPEDRKVGVTYSAWHDRLP
jgi:hypothetical protein